MTGSDQGKTHPGSTLGASQCCGEKPNESVVLTQTHNVNMTVLHSGVSSHLNGHFVSKGIKSVEGTFARYLEVQLFA